jgi:cytochrome c556
MMKLRMGLCATIMLAALPASAAEDMRQLVKMPPEARAEMRAEMLDFQAALHAVIGALAEGRFDEASAAAESQMGLSAMGRHRNAPANARPGMFMPNEMHAIARGMHVSASDFAKAAKTGDRAGALGALQSVTGACVSCHRSYRTQ